MAMARLTLGPWQKGWLMVLAHPSDLGHCKNRVILHVKPSLSNKIVLFAFDKGPLVKMGLLNIAR